VCDHMYIQAGGGRSVPTGGLQLSLCGVRPDLKELLHHSGSKTPVNTSSTVLHSYMS